MNQIWLLGVDSIEKFTITSVNHRDLAESTDLDASDIIYLLQNMN